jgi:beta propeller repeat protein
MRLIACFLLCMTICVSVNALTVVNETRIMDNEYAQMEPALYWEFLVYTEVQNETSYIMLMDLSSGEFEQITNGSADGKNPSMYRDHIAWEDNRSGNWDIYLYNLTSGEEMPIASAEVDERNPGLWEDRVVWSANLSGNYDVFLYNLSTGETTQVTDNPEDQFNPDIWEDRIVFTDVQNGGGEKQISVYNLTTGEEWKITVVGGGLDYPDIHEDRVVWNWSFGNASVGDIFCTDLSSGENYALVVHDGDQGDPAIWGNRIVWSHQKKWDGEIYIGELVADTSNRSSNETTPYEGNIVDLIDYQYIDVVATGHSVDFVNLTITNLMDHPVTVYIPVGTVYLSNDASVQDMVSTGQTLPHLGAHETESSLHYAACLNIKRKIPHSNDQFTLQASCDDDLKKLLQLMAYGEHIIITGSVEQAAIWIVTDDADYDDLGILVDSLHVRVIHEKDAARAMQLVDQAGIPIESRAIWQDRSRIIEGLSEETDAELIAWLSG